MTVAAALPRLPDDEHDAMMLRHEAALEVPRDTSTSAERWLDRIADAQAVVGGGR